ncbi:hypothetical protein AOR11_18450 [Vibrio alginolyticus]|nr:hypothetical protein [Vibrio alginolyticus]KPN01244.1 hypothetical protein AOR11_18450 [Vibrio alginolyticus]
MTESIGAAIETGACNFESASYCFWFILELVPVTITLKPAFSRCVVKGIYLAFPRKESDFAQY